MTGTSRAACSGCSHIGALHNAHGCRIGGCRCAEFTSWAGPDDAPVLVTRGEHERLAHQVHALAAGLLVLAVLAVLQAVLP